MGLGIFIADTLIGMTGGTLALANRPMGENGAEAAITWPRIALETGSDRQRDEAERMEQ
jgi:hypothetical protein